MHATKLITAILYVLDLSILLSLMILIYPTERAVTGANSEKVVTNFIAGINFDIPFVIRLCGCLHATYENLSLI